MNAFETKNHLERLEEKINNLIQTLEVLRNENKLLQFKLNGSLLEINELENKQRLAVKRIKNIISRLQEEIS